MSYDDQEYTKKDYEKFKKMLEALSKDNSIFNNTINSMRIREEGLENKQTNPNEHSKTVVTPINDLNGFQRKNDKEEG